MKRFGDGMELFVFCVVMIIRVSEFGLVGFWDVCFVEKVWDIVLGVKGILIRLKFICYLF